MRNYTAPKEKIERLSIKYNLPLEEVNRIVKSNDCILTFEELKIKYDNQELGKLPDWLTEEQLETIIWSVIHKLYSREYAKWTTKTDLFSELYLRAKMKMNEYKGPGYLTNSMHNWMVHLGVNHNERNVHFAGSMDAKPKTAETIEDEALNYGDYIAYFKDNGNIENEIPNIDMKNRIENITDQQIKDILITTAYLVCGIDEFEEDYNELLARQDSVIKNNLKSLENKLDYNIVIDEMRETGLEADKKYTIKLQDVVAAYNYDEVYNNAGKLIKKSNGIKLDKLITNFKNVLLENAIFE